MLINNAGAIFSDRRVTAEGLEKTFALNHMSYFVVTAALLDCAEGGAGAAHRLHGLARPSRRAA